MIKNKDEKYSKKCWNFYKGYKWSRSELNKVIQSWEHIIFKKVKESIEKDKVIGEAYYCNNFHFLYKDSIIEEHSDESKVSTEYIKNKWVSKEKIFFYDEWKESKREKINNSDTIYFNEGVYVTDSVEDKYKSTIPFDIQIKDNYDCELRKVYNGITLVSAENEKFNINMRDTGFEFWYNGVPYEAKNGKLGAM